MAAGILDLFSHLVGAIVSAAAGLVIWDIGTRSPAAVLADAIAASRSPAALARGALRFVIGLIFAGISVGLLFFALPENEFGRYTLYQTGAFLAALAVELLIGNQVRQLLGVGKGTRTG